MKTKAFIFAVMVAIFSAMPVSSQTAQENFDKGMKHFDQKEYSQAIECFDAAIKIEPDFSVAFLERGIAKLLNQEYRGAIYDFNKVIELDPENCEAYLYRSKAKEKTGDPEGAKKDKENQISCWKNLVKKKETRIWYRFLSMKKN